MVVGGGGGVYSPYDNLEHLSFILVIMFTIFVSETLYMYRTLSPQVPTQKELWSNEDL